MLYNNIYYDDIGTLVQYSLFMSKNDIDEFHVIINLDFRSDSFLSQLERMKMAEQKLSLEDDLKHTSVIFKRYFLSDAVNQISSVFDKANDEDCASVIQQPPLNGTKIGLWMYLVRNVKVENKNNTTYFTHNKYSHFWNWAMQSSEGDSYSQTQTLLDNYSALLDMNGMNMKDNCIRTWFYVRDVDIQYLPMVVARREFFEKQGMTKDSHFIASTGICGVSDLPKAIIQMGAYSVKGLTQGQQTYIKALSNLNPTHEYGVTFERGTVVHYGDRNHIFISGTASINNKGEVVFVNDVVKQTYRMWDNVRALLDEANSSFDDIMQIVVYLRDTADYSIVKNMFDEKFPDVPRIITLAPVCRPNWLIEMECMAIKKSSNPEFDDF